MRKTVLFLLLITLGSIIPSQAQNNTTFGGVGYFGFRVNNYDLSSMNASLKSNGIPELSETFFGYGGGGHAYIGRLIIGGEGGFQTADKNNGVYRSNFSGSLGFFNIGYLALNTSKCMISPIVGFGGGTYKINIYDPASTDFTSLLNNPSRGTLLKTELFLMDVGLQANLFLFDSKFFSVGLKTGYQFAPVKSTWTDYNGTLANGPEFNPNALYGQINFTFGGFAD
jgi:hypothetical protein